MSVTDELEDCISWSRRERKRYIQYCRLQSGQHFEATNLK
jgi:hypothetical protein